MAHERVRLIDIAQKLGLSVSGVSQALRANPRIPPATRQLVEETAKAMGYVPDPAMGALSAYRSTVATPSYRGNLAIVSTYLPFQEWMTYAWAQELHQGLEERAQRLGYKLEYFYTPFGSKEHQAMSGVLAARGTQGIILLPDILHAHAPRTQWDSFAVVEVFGNPYLHSSHCVASNHYAEMTLVLNQLHQRGYERPGFFLVQQVSETSERDWLASFLAHRDLFLKWSPDCLYLVQGGTPEYSQGHFQAWLKQAKPDVLINGTGFETYQWLEKAGLRAPADLGYCTLDYQDHPEEASGIKQSIHGIGVAAVNQLVAMIHRQEKGPVENPTSILVHGKWMEGETLRK